MDLSNNVYNLSSNKLPTLTASTSLLENVSNISSINYNNLINITTDFQSDRATTIINKPDLNLYAIKSNVDTSLNTITTALGTKQNIISVSTPLIKDASNNRTIDLSAYPL